MYLRYAFALTLAMMALGGTAHAVMESVQPSESLVRREHRPLDEDRCPPSTIVSLPITITGNTGSSSHDYDLTCVTSYTGDDIYALSLSCRTQVTVSLCGSGYDTAVEVLHGVNYFDCPGSQVLACNDDYCGLQSQVSFFAEIGEFYFIIVSGYEFSFGPYTMTVT